MGSSSHGDMTYTLKDNPVTEVRIKYKCNSECDPNVSYIVACMLIAIKRVYRNVLPSHYALLFHLDITKTC